MSTITDTQQPTNGDISPRVPGSPCLPLQEFERQHRHLLDLHSQEPVPEELESWVTEFILRGRTTGATIDDRGLRHRCQTALDYWSIYLLRANSSDGERLDSRLQPFDPALTPHLDDEQFPYGEETLADPDVQELLGWRQLIDECELDLANDGLLLIVSEPRSGEEYLIDKLLLPRLQQGRARPENLTSSETWRYYRISLDGAPIDNLLRAIAAGDGQDEAWVKQQAAELRQNNETLHNALRIDSEPPAMLVFEDLSSLLKCPDEERGPICENLAHLLGITAAGNQNHFADDSLRGRRSFAIATLRRDQVASLSKFGPLEAALRHGRVQVAFSTGALRHLIEEPARQVGLIFEHGVVDRILIDIQGEPAALPLLQFTLRRLWGFRDRNKITNSIYNTAGGGRDALCNAMEEVWKELTPEDEVLSGALAGTRLRRSARDVVRHDEELSDQQQCLKNILLALISFEAGDIFTLCCLSRGALCAKCGDRDVVDDVLNRLIQRGLLDVRVQAANASSETEFIAIACSTLLVSWPTLVGWLDESRTKRRFRLRLEEAAERWKDSGKPRDLLWRGAMQAEAQLEFGSVNLLTANELAFLTESGRLRTRKARKRQLIYLGAAVIILSMLLGAYQYQEIARVQQQRLDNAMGSINQGDLSGAMLWLDARNGFLNRIVAGKDEREQKMLNLLAVQSPSLDYWHADDEKFLNERISRRQAATDKTTASVAQKKKFQALTICPKGNWLAVAHSRQYGPQKDRFLVRVKAIQDGASSTSATDFIALHGRFREREFVHHKTNGPALLFHESDSRTYLFAVGGNELVAWLTDDSDPLEWTPLNVSGPIKLSLPITRMMNLGNTIVTVHASQEPGKSSEGQLDAGKEAAASMRFWRIAKHAGGRIQLEPVQEPTPSIPGSLIVRRVVCHTSDVFNTEGGGDGDVLAAICAKNLDDDEPTNLVVWRKEKGTWQRIDGGSGQAGTASIDPERAAVGWKVNEALTPSSSWIRMVRFSPDGRRLATARDDGQVLIWSIQANLNDWTIKPMIATEISLGSAVYDLAYPSQDVIVTSGRDRTVRFWEVSTRLEVAPRVYHEGTVGEIAFTGSDKVVTRTEKMLRIWQSPEYGRVAPPTRGERTRGSASSIALDHAIDLGQRGQDSAEVELKAILPQDILVRKINDLLIIAGSAGVDKPIMLSQADKKSTVVFEPTGKQFTFTHEAKDAIDSTPLTLNFTLGNWAEESALKPTGELAYFAHAPSLDVAAFHSGSEVNWFALAGKKKDNSSKQAGAVYLGKISSQEAALTQADTRWQGLPLRIPVPDNDLRSTAPHEEKVLSVAFSTDGQLLATGGKDDKVKLWKLSGLTQDVEEVATREKTWLYKEKPVLLHHSSDVLQLAFAPQRPGYEEKRLATVTSEGEAAVWTITNGIARDKADFKLRHDAKIRSIAFSPDGKWLITGGDDSKARVWSSEDGNLVWMFLHRGPVTEVRLLPGGGILTVSSTSRDQTGSIAVDSSAKVTRYLNYWPEIPSPKDADLPKELLAARQIEDMRIDVLSSERLTQLVKTVSSAASP